MSPVRRPIAVILVVLHVAGCTSYRPSPLSPEQAVEEQASVRLRLHSREAVELSEPWVRNDSIGGLRHVWSGSSQQVVRVPVAWSMPVDSVEVLSTRQRDTLKTVGAVLMVAGVVGAALFAMVCWGGDCFYGSQ